MVNGMLLIVEADSFTIFSTVGSAVVSSTSDLACFVLSSNLSAGNMINLLKSNSKSMSSIITKQMYKDSLIKIYSLTLNRAN